MRPNGSFTGSIKDKHFPFRISNTIGVAEKSRNLHWHKEVEICFVKRGTGKYLINGRVFPFSAGDVFIINNDEIHLAYDDCNLIMQVVLFDLSILWAGGTNVMDYEYLKPFLEVGESFSNKLSKNHEHIGKVIDVLKEIESEHETMDEGYELMIKSLLLKLMTIIIRHFRNEYEGCDRRNISLRSVQRLKAAADYIEQYYTRPIKLEELAQVSKMSVSHFCSMFHVFAGTSPMEYIIRRRMSAIKELLKNTDKKILEIATECGFNSLSNFNRGFRMYAGISPSEYRKS